MNIKLLFASFLMTLAVSGQTVPSYVPTNGLVGWWPFNGNANDESGNGRNGAVNGATLTLDRFNNPNSAYYFDGSGVNIASSCDGFSTSDRTISFWFNAADIGIDASGRAFLGYGGNGACGTSSFVAVNDAASGSSNSYEISGHCQNQTVLCSYGSTHPNNQWVNLVITNNQTDGARFYLNGILSCISTVYINQTYTTGGSLYFGTISNFSGSAAYWDSNVMPFKGKLDDIGIWNRALSQSEVNQLYLAQSTNPNINGGTSGNNVTNNFPTGISYQAIARDSIGQPLANRNATIRFTLRDSSITGAAVYTETHSVTTNSLGLFTAVIGTGTATSGTYASVNWMGPQKFLSVEMDTGSGFELIGSQQLLSVPYANSSNDAIRAKTIKNASLPVFFSNASAIAGGLQPGDTYRTPTGVLMIVY